LPHDNDDDDDDDEINNVIYYFVLHNIHKEEISALAQDTRESQQFLFTNCFSLSPATSSQFTFKLCAASEDSKNL